MDTTKTIIQALIQSTVALASIKTLKSVVLTSEELKKEYADKFSPIMIQELNSLNDLIDEKMIANIVQEMKQQGLL